MDKFILIALCALLAGSVIAADTITDLTASRIPTGGVYNVTTDGTNVTLKVNNITTYGTATLPTVSATTISGTTLTGTTVNAGTSLYSGISLSVAGTATATTFTGTTVRAGTTLYSGGSLSVVGTASAATLTGTTVNAAQAVTSYGYASTVGSSATSVYMTQKGTIVPGTATTVTNTFGVTFIETPVVMWRYTTEGYFATNPVSILSNQFTITSAPTNGEYIAVGRVK